MIQLLENVQITDLFCIRQLKATDRKKEKTTSKLVLHALKYSFHKLKYLLFIWNKMRENWLFFFLFHLRASGTNKKKFVHDFLNSSKIDLQPIIIKCRKKLFIFLSIFPVQKIGLANQINNKLLTIVLSNWDLARKQWSH